MTGRPGPGPDLRTEIAALAVAEEALGRTGQQHGEQSAEYGRLLADTGVLAHRAGDPLRAGHTLDRAIAILGVLGDPTLATTLLNRGRLYRAAGDMEAAAQVLGSALAAALGSEGTATVAVDIEEALVSTLRTLGRFTDAAELAEQAVDRARRQYGEQSPRHADLLHELALVLFDRGDPAGAAAAEQQVLVARQAVSGDAHPSVADALGNLGAAAARAGWVDDAARWQREAVAAWERIPGQQRRVAAARRELATIYAALGAHRSARREADRAIETLRATGGDHDPRPGRSAARQGPFRSGRRGRPGGRPRRGARAGHRRGLAAVRVAAEQPG